MVAFLSIATVLFCLGFGHSCLASSPPGAESRTGNSQFSILNSQFSIIPPPPLASGLFYNRSESSSAFPIHQPTTINDQPSPACLGFGHSCLGAQPSTTSCSAQFSSLGQSLCPPCFGGSSLPVPQPSTINHQLSLAQLPAADPAHLGNWLVSAAAALSIAALGKQFVRKTPLETQFLTRKEFAEFREKLDQDLNSISAKIDHAHDMLSHRLDVLGVRLDEVRSLVDRVDERTKGRSKRES